MSIIHLNIGSNIAPRHQHLSAAIDALKSEFKSSTVKVSTTVESEPWGFDSTNRFLNCGVMIETPEPVDPFTLLPITQALEKRLGLGIAHRNPDGSYADRALDIDIIAVDRLLVTTPHLSLPHPRASIRPFVMGPLTELDPATAAWLSELKD
ncbi:MAG: 2-amino-4-hydroxy-6-hydroxymethyldihydropteridine diphosphokinase [Muribaculaceae bacterium]|nr:2-amino-4-hydroxy-6-hydroxymethyldihydropteridine diphosphokinase [Muribaculaceae bacterium]